ncbi:MAG TPA: TlpA disulfide reductase family protein [Nocardioides sp.]|nr:TlpA disulfide reductase family protein [Nocardioides sp.]
MRRPLAAAAVAALSAAVLLTSCGARDAAGACNVTVSSADLVAARQQAGIADCTAKDLAVDASAPAAQLPTVPLGCLGSTATAPLSDVKGPAIINFWSSTCGPCRKEMPALAAFAKKYAGQVTVVGVDYLETYPGAALDLAQQSGVTYPLLADACGDLQQTDLLQPPGLPYFYVVHPDGTVSKPIAGGLGSEQDIVDLAEHNGITLKQAG